MSIATKTKRLFHCIPIRVVVEFDNLGITQSAILRLVFSFEGLLDTRASFGIAIDFRFYRAFEVEPVVVIGLIDID